MANPIRHLAGKRFGTLVAADLMPERSARGAALWSCECDCGSRRIARGSKLVEGAVRDCGGPAHPRRRATRRPLIGYKGAHARVARDKGGPAKAFPCSDCGEPAAQWSYNYTDPDALLSTAPGPCSNCWYSLSADHYSARCTACHARFDMMHGGA
jgi:hypothetical protein